MLLEVIFLVLSAVVLTVVGVGMVGYKQLLKESSPTLAVIDARTIEVEYIDKNTYGRTLETGEILENKYLDDIEKIVIGLHEGVHSFGKMHPVHGPKFGKYTGEVGADRGSESYAIKKRDEELEAGNPAIARMWENVAYRIIEVYRNAGRMNEYGTEEFFNEAEEYLDRTRIEVDPDRGELIEETRAKLKENPPSSALKNSIDRTSILFNDKEISDWFYKQDKRYGLGLTQSSNKGGSGSQDMRLVTKDMKKDGGEVLKTLRKYLGGGLEAGVKLYDDVATAVEGVKYDPAKKTYNTDSIKEFSAKKQKGVRDGAIELLKGK